MTRLNVTSVALAVTLLAACGSSGEDDETVLPDRNDTRGQDSSNGNDSSGDPLDDPADDVSTLDTLEDSQPEDGDAAPDDSTDDAPDTVPDDTDAPEAVTDIIPLDSFDDETSLCAQVTQVATAAALPVDIVLLVDNSSSMAEEVALIEQNLNLFAERIGFSGIDYRVVLIGREEDEAVTLPIIGTVVSYYGVCVPPPLSGADVCPDTDSSRYRHIRQVVDSTNGLDVFLDTFSTFSGFLRAGAKMHIVIVTDDESVMSATAFRAEAAVLPAPGVPADMVFHSIVALEDNVGGGCAPPLIPCDPSSCGTAVGNTYRNISTETGGVVFPICNTDWAPVFDAIFSSVLETAVIPCSFQVPEPGEGLVVDPDRVNVYFTQDGGARELIPNVDRAEDCGPNRAWYFDDPANPELVRFCEAACGLTNGQIELEFGCNTIKI